MHTFYRNDTSLQYTLYYNSLVLDEVVYYTILVIGAVVTFISCDAFSNLSLAIIHASCSFIVYTIKVKGNLSLSLSLSFLDIRIIAFVTI